MINVGMTYPSPIRRSLFLGLILVTGWFPSGSYAASNPDSGYPLSPEVHSDRKVTLRLQAPQAKKVEVRGSLTGGKNLPLTLSDSGLWEITVGPVIPDIHDYAFTVDGTYTLDPSNRRIKAWRRSSNLVEVSSGQGLPWEVSPGPKGTVHWLRYDSKSLEVEREAYVYLPPGYDPSRPRPYPMLLLLHGSGDDASAWTRVGVAHRIADHYIRSNVAEPMVIVMPHGHASLPGVNLQDLPDRQAWGRANNSAVFRDILDDLLPLVRSRYLVARHPEHCAVAGLSMGGGQAMELGLNHPEVFQSIAAFSSALPEKEESAAKLYPELAKGSSDRPNQWIWVGCGREDFLFQRNEFFHQWLTNLKVEHEYHATEGAHSWPVWRSYLMEVLPRLFHE